MWSIREELRGFNTTANVTYSVGVEVFLAICDIHDGGWWNFAKRCPKRSIGDIYKCA